MADTPADVSAFELDALWDEFHHVVNMTSMELGAWLGALPDDEAPDGADPACGERVLLLLHKRRIELTDEDVRTMYDVVDAVADEADAGTDARRRRLMTLGHDPLKTP